MAARCLIALALVIVSSTANQAQTPEATSLFGRPLMSIAPSAAQKARLEADLAKAQADYDRDPSNADAAIWLGRRIAYLGRYRDAIEVFSRGIARHPNEPRFYRHRGHRYITIRKFDLAVADLRRASALVSGRPDEIEPDGAPNQAGIPRSTLQSNIWYHLGLAHYLRGDFTAALASYREGMKVSRVNDDMLVATSDWLYMTLRRLRRDAEAAQVLEPIREQMDVLENGAYHARLLMYKGLRSPESVLNLNTADDVQIATQGYGVGNWYLMNGDRAKAREIFELVTAGTAWTAFGFIAAEADLTRGFGAARWRAPVGRAVGSEFPHPSYRPDRPHQPYLMKSISRYVASGHVPCGIITSRRSPVSRSASIAGTTASR
jgi:tetratricopeptide (TPR) repeat protein